METLEKIFDQTDPDAILRSLMPALCQILDCDRCFLYLRDPETRASEVTHCYSRSPEFLDLTGEASIEPEDIAAIDPLMEIAFRTPESVYVEDVETASPDVINLDYENEFYGHRALIHTPLYWQNQLHGILEPCVFHQPRVWTAQDRMVIDWTQAKLIPVMMDYLRQFPLKSQR